MPGWVSALALGVGLLAGHIAIYGIPQYPPREPGPRLFYLIAAASVLGLLETAWRAPLAMRWGMRVALTGTTVWLLLRPVMDLDSTRAMVWPLALTVALLGAWWSIDALVARAQGPSLPLALLVTLACAAPTLLLSGSVRFAQLGGALATALVVFAFAAWLWPEMTLTGATAVFVIAYYGLILCGRFYAYLPTSSSLLLAVAPPAAWAGELRWVRRAAWAPPLVRVLAAAIPAAAALVIVLRESDLSAY
ncbi:MAG TPA: hypothetical protein VGM03_24980 [Phycisphaerae bacterium]|jgi:hypothetical protein